MRRPISLGYVAPAVLLLSMVPALSGQSQPNPPAPRFREIYTGMQATCGLDASGQAFCWGIGSIIGDGTRAGVRDGSVHPKAVQHPDGVKFTQLAVGFGTACGLTAEGRAYCWGEAAYGQTGDGEELRMGGLDHRFAPIAVRHPDGVSFTQLTVGGDHSCGLARDGKVFCWGVEGWGIPYAPGAAHARTPVQIESGEVRFRHLSATQSRTCAVATDGSVYCWGTNTRGELGDGTTTPSKVPVRVRMPAGLALASVSTGSNHTCGLDQEGNAYCWGINYDGQLGTGNATDQAQPTRVSLPAGVTLRAIGTGDRYSCGLATDGQAYCWGRNGRGFLGDGTNQDRNVPTAVRLPTGVRFSRLSVSPRHTCGVTEAGASYCWGGATTGELGDGARMERNAPVEVKGGVPFVETSRPAPSFIGRP